MNAPRRIAATTAALGLALAAVAAPAAQAAPSTDSLGPAPADCKVDTAKLAAETPAPMPGHSWTVGEVVDPCANLGYVLLETTGGTVSSPTAPILFHRGVPVATQPPHDARVLPGGHSEFHVTLRFQQPPAEGQANAAATYRPTTYVWNPLAGDVAAVDVPFGS